MNSDDEQYGKLWKGRAAHDADMISGDLFITEANERRQDNKKGRCNVCAVNRSGSESHQENNEVLDILSGLI
jgi:hypothetical protein